MTHLERAAIAFVKADEAYVNEYNKKLRQPIPKAIVAALYEARAELYKRAAEAEDLEQYR